METKCKNKKCKNTSMEGKKYCEYHQSKIDNLIKAASKVGICAIGLGVQLIIKKKPPMS